MQVRSHLQSRGVENRLHKAGASRLRAARGYALWPVQEADQICSGIFDPSRPFGDQFCWRQPDYARPTRHSSSATRRRLPARRRSYSLAMRRRIVRASSCVIWSATVRVSSARKRQCSGSQKRTFCKASYQLVGEMLRRSSSAVATSRAGRHQHRSHRVLSSRVHFLDKGRSHLGGLLICAKDLFVEATRASKPCHSTGSSTATTIKSHLLPRGPLLENMLEDREPVVAPDICAPTKNVGTPNAPRRKASSAAAARTRSVSGSSSVAQNKSAARPISSANAIQTVSSIGQASVP